MDALNHRRDLMSQQVWIDLELIALIAFTTMLSLRRLMPVLLALSLIAGGLPNAVAAPVDSSCATTAGGEGDSGCCGDELTGTACAAACPAGSAALLAAIPQFAWIGLSVLPAAFPPPRLGTQAQAPDTAPPKRS